MKHLIKGAIGGIAIVSFLNIAACNDEDVIVTPPPGSTTPVPNNGETPGGDDVTGADDLTSGDALPDGGAGDTPDEPVANACDACPAQNPQLAVSCCTGQADVDAYRAVTAGVCGLDMSPIGFPGCVQLNQPGELDSNCPEVNLGGPSPLPGCCTPAGHCGAMDTFMGMGCTSSPDPSTWIDCGG